MPIKVNYKGGRLGSKLNKARFKRVNAELANQVMADMDQFVPYKNGPLANSAHVAANDKTIVYTVPYARAQFYGIINGSPVVNYTRTEHPQATKRWDLKAKSLYLDQWQTITVQKLLGGDNRGS